MIKQILTTTSMAVVLMFVLPGALQADQSETNVAAVGLDEQAEGSGAPERQIPPVMRSGFDRDSFEEFIEARIGTGETVYWYGMGVINSYPDGKPLARLEGVDLGKLYRPNPDEPEAYMITRKFSVFRDPDTGELMRDEAGKMRFIAYDYQYFKWTLEGDDLRYEIESGTLEKLKTTIGTGGNEIRRMGDLTVITTPVPINSPVVQAWEKYDFLIMPEGSAEPRHQIVWGKYTPNFSWMPEGFSTMHSWLYRYDDYDALPDSIRTIIEEEPGMDLWREPPKDVDEIRELQRTGKDYR